MYPQPVYIVPPPPPVFDDAIKDDCARGGFRAFHGNQKYPTDRDPIKWVHDKERDNCTTCKKKFTQKRHRHHCRRCADIFCRDCVVMSNWYDANHIKRKKSVASFFSGFGGNVWCCYDGKCEDRILTNLKTD